jgi:hypothetical protein
MWGDLVFVAFEDAGMKTLRNVTCKDFRDIADHLSTAAYEPEYDRDVTTIEHDHASYLPGKCVAKAATPVRVSNWPVASTNPTEWPSRAHKVKGVRLSCFGDGNITFTKVEFLRDHPFLSDTARYPPMQNKGDGIGINVPGFDVPGLIGLPLSWIRNQVGVKPDPNSKPLKKESEQIFYSLMPELFIEHKIRES